MLIALAAVAAVILAVLVAIFGLSVFIFCRINNKRYNGNKNVKYFTASDFAELEADPVSFPSDGGQTLRGFVYRKKTVVAPKALLVFAHGFGAGHLSYTTEINTFAEAGYWILAYDATGCAGSDGKNIRGFDQGVIDLLSAVHFAQSDERLRDLKKILVGHSWGGFCAMNAVSAEDIVGAVAICGFISGAKVLAQNTVGKKFPWLAFIAEGFLRLMNRLRLGGNANKNSLNSLRKTDKPVYLIYGTDDKTVVFRKNGAVMAKKLQNSSNIRCRICKGKGHNPYLTEEAERSMNATFSEIAKQKKKDLAAALQMYEEIDYVKITEEDESVMRSIVEFCDGIAVR